MKVGKKLSIMLICVMIVNMLFTFTAFATEDITSDEVKFNTNKTTVAISPANNGAITALSDANTATLYSGGWFEYTVYTEQPGDYKFSVYCGTSDPNAKLSVSVNGTEYITNAVPTKTENIYTWTWTDLGEIRLTNGENVIKVTASVVDCMFNKIKLTKVTEDITIDPIEFETNASTVNTYNPASGSVALWGPAVALYTDGWFEYTINTQTAKDYKLSIRYNTTHTAMTVSAGVANGTQISNVSLPATSGEGPYAELGTISLKPGPNVIRITRTQSNDSGAYVTVSRIKLEAVQQLEEDITTDPIEFETNKSTVVSYNDASGSVGPWDLCMALYTDGWFEYTVNTQTAKDYKLSIRYNTTHTAMKVSAEVADGTQISNVSLPATSGEGSYAELGTISLKPGPNVIRIECKASVGENDYITVSRIKLESAQEIEEQLSETVTDFKVNNTTISNSNCNAGDLQSYCVTLLNQNWFEYAVSTAKPGTYKVYLRVGAKEDNLNVDFSVNGSTVSSGVGIPNNGAYDAYSWEPMGIASLNAGENVLRFKSNAVGSICVYRIRLERINYSYPVGVGSVLDAGNTSYKEQKITVGEAGWYGVTVNMASTVSAEFAVSTGAQEITENAPATGGYDKYKDNYIGKVYLTEGENTVRLTAKSGNAKVAKFTFGKMYEEINDSSVNIAVTPKTVGYMTGYSENDTDCSANDSLNLRVGTTNDKSFTIGVYTDKALDYTISPTYIAKYEAMSLNVAVNGKKVISGAELITSASNKTSDVGVIHLTRGINEITLDADGKVDEELTIRNIRLDAVNSFASGEFTKALTEGNAEETCFNETYTSGYNGDYAIFRPISWVEYDVYTPAERIVTLRLNAAATTDTTYTVRLNGVQNYVETLSAVSSSTTEFKNATSQVQVTLPAGHSVIRYTQKSGLANIKSITVQNYETNEIKVKAFELQDEYGYMVPKVVTEGLDIYAVAELQKLGAEIKDKVSLVVAQYTEDGKYYKLKKCNVETIDFSDAGVYDIKTCKLKFKLEGEGGTVKAFLYKASNLQPLAEQIGYTEIKLVSDDIINEPAPEYCLAEELTNSSGVNYGTYHKTNAQGTVQAIFYDSVIPTTGQQKVFAYMGIPTKDANGNAVSEDNPVPAVVVLHGGQGKAEYTWVQKWMNKGYAAIALDLYGNGPDNAAHPYKGIKPWEETIFKGIETSGMYQNVVNIIRAHTLIMSMPGVDETKTALTGLSMGGMTTANAIGIDTRFDAGVPIYGTRWANEKSYTQGGHDSNWDSAITMAKANVPIMILMGDEDTNFTVKGTASSYTVLKDGYFSIYHKLPHSQIAENFGQVYDFIENVFKGEEPYVRITEEVVENNTLTAKCTVPTGTTITKIETYYMTSETNPTADNEYEWGLVTDYTLSDGVLSVNIPGDAKYCYTSVHFSHEGFTSFDTSSYNKDLIISTKLLEVK